MTRIRVDFNNLARGGQVRVSLRRVAETLTPGDFVEVYDPDAELECQAVVMDVDRGAGQLYLRPLWGEQEAGPAANPTGGSARVFVWDGHRVAPVSAQATNLAGGTTLAKTSKVAPVLIETGSLTAAI